MTETIEDRAIETVPCLAGSVAGEGLKMIRLCPWGEAQSKHGTFIVDDEAAQACIEAFTKHQTPLVIDYEHQTLGREFSSPSGQAPAAGWIRQIWKEAGKGLLALVEWTDMAREAIRAKQYQFLSPVVAVRKSDRRAVELHSVGLTNKPAIAGMDALAASNRLSKETETEIMPQQATEGQGGVTADALLGQLAGLVGLEPKGDILEVLKQIIGKVKTLVGQGSDADSAVASSVRELLGLEPDASKSEVILAMKMQESTELQSMREAEAIRLAEAHVHKYVEENKLNPNDKPAMEAAHSLSRENPERLDALMANAKPYATPGKTEAPPRYGRHRTIANAVRDYNRDPAMQKTCDVRAAIGLALREAGMVPLSDDEAREYVTA